MAGSITFDFPLGWLFGLPLAAVLAWGAWRQYQRGLPIRRTLTLISLRAGVLLLLVFLAARPIWFAKDPPAAASRSVVVLIDRSQSMSLDERESTRFQQAFDFLRQRLLPALKSANLPVQAITFDQNATPADGEKLSSTVPNGKRTNLAGAIAQAFVTAGQPPLAVLGLTDGIANENADNTRALTLLADNAVPF